jgi:hypothetical protein
LAASAIAVTINDLLWVVAGHEGAPDATINVTWDQAVTNTGTLTIQNYSNGDMSGTIFYARATTTGTITATLNTASRTFRAMVVGSETPDSGKILTFDKSVAAQGVSTTPSAGSASPAGAGFAVAGGKLYGSQACTAGSGWTEVGTNGIAIFAETRRPPDTSSISGNWTMALEDWVAHMAIFQETQVAFFNLAWIKA